MSSDSCFINFPFSLSGTLASTSQQVQLAFTFEEETNAAAVLAYEWYVNGLLLLNYQAQTLSVTLPGGYHRIGGRLLTAGGWSGVIEQVVEAAAIPTRVTIEGPDDLREGESAAYRVVAYLSGGVTEDVTSQYMFTATEGSFSGTTLTIPNDNLPGTARTVYITVSRQGADPVTRAINVRDAAVVVLNDFDYMVVRYNWQAGAGADLDILVGFENNGTDIDGVYVGYGWEHTLPSSVSQNTDAFLWWAVDNTSDAGYEAVLVGIDRFVEHYSEAPDEIEVGLYAVWFRQVLSGDFSVELVTYKGGDMMISGSNIVNEGGVKVSSNAFQLHTAVSNTLHGPSTSHKLGMLRYNKISKKAVVQIF